MPGSPGGAREVKCCQKGDLCTSLNVTALRAPFPAEQPQPCPTIPWDKPSCHLWGGGGSGPCLLCPRLRGLTLDMLAHAILKVIFVVGFAGVGPSAWPIVGCVVTELYLLCVLGGHHLLLGREEGLELAQAVSGEPARLWELHL